MVFKTEYGGIVCQPILEHQIRASAPSSVISRPTCFSSSLRCCWQVGSASFVRRRCDCLASSAPFTDIQTYLLTYDWPWTLESVTDPTTDRSGNADEDDPAERGCSRLRKTVGLTTTPGGSQMIASLGGRYDPSPASGPVSEWVSEWVSEYCWQGCSLAVIIMSSILVTWSYCLEDEFLNAANFVSFCPGPEMMPFCCH